MVDEPFAVVIVLVAIGICTPPDVPWKWQIHMPVAFLVVDCVLQSILVIGIA